MNDSREDVVVGGFAEDRIAAEAARNEAEEFRRLAEEARESRDHHREALHTIRPEPQRRRGPRRKSAGAPRRRRVRSVTIIARRSKRSDRSESGCEKPLKPHAPPAR